MRLDLAPRYPAPVRSTVDIVRVTVGEEVERITGYRVRVVDVTVPALLPWRDWARVRGAAGAGHRQGRPGRLNRCATPHDQAGCAA